MDNETQRYLGSHQARLDNIDIAIKKMDEKLDLFIEYYHKVQVEKAEKAAAAERKRNITDNILTGSIAAMVAGIVTFFTGR